MTQAALRKEENLAPQTNPAKGISLVTGGTGGIGSAICKEISNLGYHVITTYRDEEKAKRWQQEMYEQGYGFTIMKCDVTNFKECENLVKQVTEKWGSVDILINNAGITRDSSFRKMSEDQWHDVISCDLDSVFNVTQPIINSMIDKGYGRIINISSINAQKGQFGQSNYSAAKAGMHGFTKALAQEVASKGITVNTVSPGYIATDMVMAVPEKVRNDIISKIPIGRLGRPEEIAHIVNFLISDKAAFITGSNITANGGQHME